MKRKQALCFVAVTGFYLCVGVAGEPLPEKTAAAREHLTADDLLSGKMAGIVPTDSFLTASAPAGAALPFEGEVSFPETKMETTHPPTTWEGGDFQFFPEFTVSFIADSGRLIPVKRGIIRSGDKKKSVWNIIVSPGAVWKEKDDREFSRAAFPFTLTNNCWGQARNGLASFIYNKTAVSHIYAQLTQETAPQTDCPPRKDFSAMIKADYRPGKISGRQNIVSAFKTELAHRLPVKRWDRLSNGNEWINDFNKGIAEKDDLSLGAVIIDGTIFLQEVPSRAGNYPFPEEMRHGVMSCTKSIVMGLAMMYLAQKYGESVFDLLIRDYIPALADHPGWEGVTFSHALNMVTGVQGDNSPDVNGPFLTARSREDRIARIAALPDAPPKPGEKFVYGDTNTFTLSYAMNRFVKTKAGPSADYWSMVEKDVLKPIGIEHLAVLRTMEKDGAEGIPLGGAGAFPTLDEAAKIALLYQNDGVWKGKQLLHRNKVREAMHRQPWSGYPMYTHSFWQFNPDLEGQKVFVPVMLGLGDSLICFLPDDRIAIRFSDAAVVFGNVPRIALAVKNIKP